MNRKQKSKKDLQKNLNVITKTYTKQKGKANRKKLSDFIEQKIAEILSFRGNLPVKKKIQKKEKSVTSSDLKPPVVVLQPSPALADELHKNTINSLELKNAVAIQ